MNVVPLPENDLVRRARFGLRHAPEDAFPRLGLQASLIADLAPAVRASDHVRETCAHLGNRLAGLAGQLDPDDVPAVVLDALVRA